MNEKELRQNVIDELDFEPSIDSANIGIAAEHGVVTLTGHVPSYAQRWAAERAVWRVKGVKAIANDIEVRFPEDNKVHDDEIAQRAVRILAWNSAIPHDAIKVIVANGRIKLTGQVHWNYQRAAAESEVRKLSGVTGVTNEVELLPHVEPVDVKQRITEALKRHAEIEANGIQIEVEGGTVKIEGHVDTWGDRQAVERAVWSVPGVRGVQDHLRISESDKAPARRRHITVATARQEFVFRIVP